MSDLITSPDKVYFAERGETKLDLVAHYQRVAEPLMRAMGGRPVLLQRFPDGAGGPSFFQKRVPKNAPDWLADHGRVHAERHDVARRWSRPTSPTCSGRSTWAASASTSGRPRRPTPSTPTSCASTSIPSPGVDFPMVQEAAREVHALLDELGVTGYPKTTGNRGIHVYVRLAPQWTSYRGALRRGGRRPRARAAPARPDHRRLVEGGARRAGSSSTSTRTRRTRPSSARGRCGPDRARRSRRRSRWDELDAIDPDELTIATVPGPARARTATRGRAMDDRPAVARAPPGLHERDPADGLPGRAVAAGLPEDAGRAAPGGAEPGEEAARLLVQGRVGARRETPAARGAGR